MLSAWILCVSVLLFRFMIISGVFGVINSGMSLLGGSKWHGSQAPVLDLLEYVYVGVES